MRYTSLVYKPTFALEPFAYDVNDDWAYDSTPSNDTIDPKAIWESHKRPQNGTINFKSQEKCVHQLLWDMRRKAKMHRKKNFFFLNTTTNMPDAMKGTYRERERKKNSLNRFKWNYWWFNDAVAMWHLSRSIFKSGGDEMNNFCSSYLLCVPWTEQTNNMINTNRASCLIISTTLEDTAKRDDNDVLMYCQRKMKLKLFSLELSHFFFAFEDTMNRCNKFTILSWDIKIFEEKKVLNKFTGIYCFN